MIVYYDVGYYSIDFMSYYNVSLIDGKLSFTCRQRQSKMNCLSGIDIICDHVMVTLSY